MINNVIYELRSQRTVIIKKENGEKISIFPAEFLNSEQEISPNSKLLISDMRAEEIGIDTTAKAVSFPIDNLSVDDIKALIGIGDKPSNIPAHNDENELAFLLNIMKKSGLLPAVIISICHSDENYYPANLISLDTAQEITLGQYDDLTIFETARAKLPIDGAENTLLVSFREKENDAVHLALIIGDITKDTQPLVRVHSSCVTGDLLGSLRCDCGNQLQLALHAIKTEGFGVLLYLNQEGRGIGITNKLRAYNLQTAGMDTFSANRSLGFYDDERDFLVASLILKELVIDNIRLLSNNPHKVSALQQYGIKITERVPLIAPSGEHSNSYIKAKVDKAGHVF